jgi:hypothetical protein
MIGKQDFEGTQMGLFEIRANAENVFFQIKNNRSNTTKTSTSHNHQVL